MANSSATINQKLLEQIYNLLISKFQVTDMDQVIAVSLFTVIHNNIVVLGS